MASKPGSFDVSGARDTVIQMVDPEYTVLVKIDKSRVPGTRPSSTRTSG
jgi:hypothetical protein